jgi:hypothetical protein
MFPEARLRANKRHVEKTNSTREITGNGAG